MAARHGSAADEYTVIPPHSSGAAFSLSSTSGTGIANLEFTRTRVRISAIPPDTGRLRLRAQMFVALPAPLADAAAIRLPANPNPLAHLAVLHILAHRDNRPHNLMARDKRIFADPPVVVDQMNVGVAHPAMRNLYLNLVRFQLARLILVRHQLCAGCMHGQSMYLTHRKSFSLLIALCVSRYRALSDATTTPLHNFRDAVTQPPSADCEHRTALYRIQLQHLRPPHRILAPNRPRLHHALARQLHPLRRLQRSSTFAIESGTSASASESNTACAA